MAHLTIIYDETDPPLACIFDDRTRADGNINVAVLPISSNLSSVDLYDVARRLAELLLEQMAAGAGQMPRRT